MRLVPAIDLRDGKCVRLLHGRFDAETVYDDNPRAVLGRYRDLGARYVHVVDLDGARDGSQGNVAAIATLATGAGDVQIQVGGGVRNRAVAAGLVALGVHRVVVGSLAVTDPLEVRRWLEEFGVDRIVLAFDVRLDAGGTPRLTTHGWETQTGTSLWDAIDSYLPCGRLHVLCTDVGRDGALSGPNVELYAQATRRFPDVRWQASGGISSGADLTALSSTGVAAAISGRALLEDRIPVAELAAFLPGA